MTPAYSVEGIAPAGVDLCRSAAASPWNQPEYGAPEPRPPPPRGRATRPQRGQRRIAPRPSRPALKIPSPPHRHVPRRSLGRQRSYPQGPRPPQSAGPRDRTAAAIAASSARSLAMLLRSPSYAAAWPRLPLRQAAGSPPAGEPASPDYGAWPRHPIDYPTPGRAPGAPRGLAVPMLDRLRSLGSLQERKVQATQPDPRLRPAQRQPCFLASAPRSGARAGSRSPRARRAPPGALPRAGAPSPAAGSGHLPPHPPARPAPATICPLARRAPPAPPTRPRCPPHHT